MFFSTDLLIRKDARFALVWRFATVQKGTSSTVSKRAIKDIDISTIIKDLEQRIPSSRKGKEIKEKFSLYLHGQLIYGTCIVFRLQVDYLLEDAQHAREACKRIHIGDFVKGALDSHLGGVELMLSGSGRGRRGVKRRRTGRHRRDEDMEVEEDQSKSQDSHFTTDDIRNLDRVLVNKHYADITLNDDPLYEPIPLFMGEELQPTNNPQLWDEFMAEGARGSFFESHSSAASQEQIVTMKGPKAKRARGEEAQTIEEEHEMEEARRETREGGSTLMEADEAHLVSIGEEFPPPPEDFTVMDLHSSRSLFPSASPVPLAVAGIDPILRSSQVSASPPPVLRQVSPIIKEERTSLMDTHPLLVSPRDEFPEQPIMGDESIMLPVKDTEQEKRIEMNGNEKEMEVKTEEQLKRKTPKKKIRKMVVDQETQISKHSMAHLQAYYSSLLTTRRVDYSNTHPKIAADKLMICVPLVQPNNKELASVYSLLKFGKGVHMTLNDALAVDIDGENVDDDYRLEWKEIEQWSSFEESEDEEERKKRMTEDIAPMIVEERDEAIGVAGDMRENEIGEKISIASMRGDWYERPFDVIVGDNTVRQEVDLMDEEQMRRNWDDIDWQAPPEDPRASHASAQQFHHDRRSSILPGSDHPTFVDDSTRRTMGADWETMDDKMQREECEHAEAAMMNVEGATVRDKEEIRNRMKRACEAGEDMKTRFSLCLPTPCNSATAAKFFYELLCLAKDEEILPQQKEVWGEIDIALMPPAQWPQFVYPDEPSTVPSV